MTSDELQEALDRIAELEEENTRLCREMATMRGRIAELEDDQQSSTITTSAGGTREQAVLDVLDGHEGTTIGMQQLKELYRQETDVSNSRTLKRRVKQLTDRPAFEKVPKRGPASWRFLGDGGDE